MTVYADVRANPDECLHCNLRLRKNQSSFCCQGCKQVYELLHGSGLARYYELRNGSGIPVANRKTEQFAWLEPLLESQSNRELHRVELDIQGIHCAACVWLLETTFKRKSWAAGIHINPALGRVELTWRGEGDLTEWLKEAHEFGYTFGPRLKPGGGSSKTLVKLGVAAAAASQVMMVSLAYYFGLASEQSTLYQVLGWVAFAFATVVVMVGGPVFFKGAWAGLKNRVAHLDLPISVGILLAYAGSVLSTIQYGPEFAYFDTLAVFVTLMLTGRWLQERLLEKNRNGLLEDHGVQGLVCRKVTGNEASVVPAEDIVPGDRLWVAAGELIPMRSTLVEGRAQVSLDWITGESAPVGVIAGGSIPAGAFNTGSSPMQVESEEALNSSRLHSLLRRPRPSEKFDPSTRFWTRLAQWYVVGVLAAAAGAFMFWLSHGLDRAWPVAVSILVVTCPCAIGIAVPLATELVMHQLRRSGVYVLSTSLLEKVLRVKKVVFDKTGTLTFGHLQPSGASRKAIQQLGEDDKQVLEAMAASSNHPASAAIVASVSGAKSGLIPGIREIPGQGLLYQAGTQEYRLGKAAFAGDDDRLLDARTVFSKDGAPLIRISLEESFKSDAADEVARLKDSGLDVYLLSGDHEAKVSAAARKLGIEQEKAFPQMSPEAKASWMARLDQQDTLMIGDGINDALCFNQAYVAGTPAVHQPSLPARADFYFLGDGMSGVGSTIAAARRLRSVVKANLWTALIYNTAAVGFCAAGMVTPLVAAVLMPLSSLGVTALTMFRLRRSEALWKL